MLEMYLFQPIQENLLGGLYHQSAMDSQYIPHGHSKRIDHLSLYWLIWQNKVDLLICGVKGLMDRKQQYIFQLST